MLVKFENTKLDNIWQNLNQPNTYVVNFGEPSYHSISCQLRFSSFIEKCKTGIVLRELQVYTVHRSGVWSTVVLMGLARLRGTRGHDLHANTDRLGKKHSPLTSLRCFIVISLRPLFSSDQLGLRSWTSSSPVSYPTPHVTFYFKHTTNYHYSPTVVCFLCLDHCKITNSTTL